ncbi:polysaccharide deacetylase family protein [Marinobacter sp. M1N3S26]|uniref:polysaccharide deacetylase family protein n=1 Tax=unclassified Marinobacter TaxID=83889 RepID=UPI00387B383B
MLNRYLTLAVLITTAAVPARADLVVLQYHHISDRTPASTSTEVDLFREQLHRIQELGLEVVPLKSGTEEALAGRLEGQQQAAITFDDAYESVWTTAAPILDEYGYPYTIFVNTQAVGSPGHMTWQQLEQAAGLSHVTIANHSHDHAHLPRKPDEPRNAWHQQVTASLDHAQTLLDERLGMDEPLFAYPYGEYDAGLEQLLDERDWYGYGQQSGAIGPTSDPSRLPRFPMATAYGQMDSLDDKLRSRALPVDASELPDGIVSDNPPRLTLRLPDRLNPEALTCFASGRGRLALEPRGQEVTVQAAEAFNSRRFRYNCTYPAGEGRFYWLSQQWVDLERPED